MKRTAACRKILVAFLAVAGPQSAASQKITAVDRILYGPALVDVFRRPAGLAIDAERGIMVVADTGNHRVVLFDAMGRSRGALSWGSEQDVAAGEPRCVALDKRGRLFVLDNTSGVIEVISAAGSRLGYVEPEIPPGAHGRTRPQFVAVSASGSCYVLYSGELSGIAVVESTGRTTRVLGFSDESGMFDAAPVAMAIDAGETRIAVLEPAAAHQVKVYGADGGRLSEFGKHGEGEGTLSLPVFVAWGPGDTLWIVDTLRHSVAVFDSDGGYRTRLCGFGREPGQVTYPAACGFLADGRFVVLERAGARLQILEVSTATAGTSGLDLNRSASGGPGADELNSKGR